MLSAVGRSDDDILTTLLTTGRADLSARDTSHTSDETIMENMKSFLRRGPHATGSHNDDPGNSNNSDDNDDNNDGKTKISTSESKIFPPGQEFHRRSCALRGRTRQSWAEQEGDEGTTYHEDKVHILRGGKGSNGMSASAAAKVEWFCAALAKTAERLSGASGRERVARVFLLRVFEDFDRLVGK